MRSVLLKLRKMSHDRYYIPAVIHGSRGKGVVLVGYGGYMGYMDIADRETDEGLLVGIGGHVLHEGPLVNVSTAEKNKNFKHIQALIEQEMNRNYR